ncbi:MAG: hypothetical protein RL648_730 [Verrucomicrobiota bacterium]|jgi:anti-anti-sigma factor
MISGSVQSIPQSGKIVLGSLDAIRRRLYLEINEDVTGTHVPQMRRAILSILDGAPSEKWNTVYIDLRACRMVDSMGLNWLFAEIVRLRDADKEVVVRASSPAIQRVIEFSGLDRLVTFKFRRRKQTR